VYDSDLGEFGNNDDVTFFQPYLQKPEKGLEKGLIHSRGVTSS
jgi:hypothetical protein